MTRFLSEALQAREPAFRLGLRQLETAAGYASHDIRITNEIHQATRRKLNELGLDGRDTTPHELYQTLIERVKADERRLARTLQTLAATHVNAEALVTDGLTFALRQLTADQTSFALKPARLKAILTKQPPRRAMKKLGYRSVASLIKHEAPAAILAAGTITESRTWQKSIHDSYKKLKPADFEVRPVSVLAVTDGRWHDFALEAAASQRHNIMSFSELGSIVVLPLPAHAPAGSVLASTLTALHALGDIKTTSTYLQYSQVRPDFGTIVLETATGEPQLQSRLLDQPVSWHLIQRFYDRVQQAGAELLEPHVQLSDLTWQPVEQLLSRIDPSLEFWHGTAHLGLLGSGKVVSLNIMDAVLNVCNKLPFEQRLEQAFRKSVWHELMIRYLQPQAVEQALLSELQPKLAYEFETI